MVLSPQAARMAHLTLRRIGNTTSKRPFGGFSSRRVVSCQMTRNGKNKLSDTFQQQLKQQRFKSTRGASAAISIDTDSDEDEEQPQDLAYRHSGHATAAEYRANQPTSVIEEESWTINLGRGDDNAWLMGSRDEQEWFTGVAPVNNCPGKLETVNIVVFTYQVP